MVYEQSKQRVEGGFPFFSSVGIALSNMNRAIVMMGVAGCGKSSLGGVLAERIGARLIEGDDYHSAQSRDKMSRGVALTDDDREGWLARLGELLNEARGGRHSTVLNCSALKRAYRDRLRAVVTGLRFVYLEIGREDALQRVSERASGHFFPVELVDSQFSTLEAPTGEPLVLTLDATLPLSDLADRVVDWLNLEECP